ncbi:MAG: TonB-dependent receptor [Verrucomicrobia bacterium]|nr:TonB-dependent receptor [Cytophagales bacterium]
MWLKKLRLCFFLFLSILAWVKTTAQPCTASLEGSIFKQNTQENLTGVTVFIREVQKNAVSDAQGKYQFNNLCAGNYTLEFRSVGYKTFVKNIAINNQKTEASISLDTSIIALEAVEVIGFQSEASKLLQFQTQLADKELAITRGFSLGESLKTLPGLNSIQTGPSISKPIIHGLHSNRILILNNGIRQEGQQWGSEHAPEIDPFVANQISVIKGAAGIRYGADAIGGVILVEPSPLPFGKTLGGELNLAAFTNNRQGTLSGILQGGLKKYKNWAWRLQATGKQAGTAQTPDYYLSNSQFQERNFSMATGYRSEKTGFNIFFSRFATKIGIFSGSHISNLTDLINAFQAEKPSVNSEFYYTIGKPYQAIAHNLLKFQSYFKFEKLGKFSFTYGWQYNKREEFDLHKNFNDSIAALDLPAIRFRLYTQTAEILWEHKPCLKNFTGTMGISGLYQFNDVGGRSFLIPDFEQVGLGIFVIERWRKNKWEAEAGLRYDMRHMTVFRQINRREFPVKYDFTNVSASLGLGFQAKDNLNFRLNIGSAWRPPTVAELYSRGVHHGAAAYEMGDSSITTEKSYQATLSINYEISKKLVVDFGMYVNSFDGYIYLKPDSLPVLSIRGAFPAYTYTQTNAFFKGSDASIRYFPSKNISLQSKITLVRAWNRTKNEAVPFIPSDRIENTIRYEKSAWQSLSDIFFAFHTTNVSKQRRVPEIFTAQIQQGVETKTVFIGDFIPPPSGYMLFGTEAGFSFLIHKQKTDISLSVSNVTNVRYRDYLNRFRYFSDETGRNIAFRMKFSF